MPARNFIPAIFAALIFGISIPVSKALLGSVNPLTISMYLYAGAFLGLFVYGIIFKRKEADKNERITPKDLIYFFLASLSGGVFAPLCLFTGLTLISGFAASLTLSFEAVITVLIAGIFFKEKITLHLLVAVALLTAGIFFLDSGGEGIFSVKGFILLFASQFGWAIDNNLSARIRSIGSVDLAKYKGLVAAAILFLYAVVFRIPFLTSKAPLILLIGILSFGCSLVFYIDSLKLIGAARTAALFMAAPFIGGVLSIIMLGERPAAAGWIAFFLFLCGLSVLIGKELRKIPSV